MNQILKNIKIKVLKVIWIKNKIVKNMENFKI